MYKTGDTAPQTGRYEFVRYVDGTTSPSPTSNERIIPLSRGKLSPQSGHATKQPGGGLCNLAR